MNNQTVNVYDRGGCGCGGCLWTIFKVVIVLIVISFCLTIFTAVLL